jgi:hypothetical protein
MAQAVSRWPLTAEARFASVPVHVGIMVDKVALGQAFLRDLRFSPVNIIPPLLHTHLSPPHQVCDSPDQAARYHTLGAMLGASSLTLHLVGTRGKKINNSRRSRPTFQRCLLLPSS